MTHNARRVVQYQKWSLKLKENNKIADPIAFEIDYNTQLYDAPSLEDLPDILPVREANLTHVIDVPFLRGVFLIVNLKVIKALKDLRLPPYVIRSITVYFAGKVSTKFQNYVIIQFESCFDECVDFVKTTFKIQDYELNDRPDIDLPQINSKAEWRAARKMLKPQKFMVTVKEWGMRCDFDMYTSSGDPTMIVNDKFKMIIEEAGITGLNFFLYKDRPILNFNEPLDS